MGKHCFCCPHVRQASYYRGLQSHCTILRELAMQFLFIQKSVALSKTHFDVVDPLFLAHVDSVDEAAMH